MLLGGLCRTLATPRPLPSPLIFGMVHPINDISGAGVAPVYNNTGCGYTTPGCLNSSHWEALYGLASNRSVCRLPSSAWVLPLLAM